MGAGRRLGAVAVAVVGAGILVNIYLAVAGRSLTEGQYSHFGAFWSIALVVGFGAFLPVEQELARVLQTRADTKSALRAAAMATLGLTVGALLVLAACTGPLKDALGDDAALLGAVAALVAASALQFFVRGSLVGLNRIGTHGVIILVDATLRVALCSWVAVAVRSPSAADFAWTLVLAITLAHLPMLPVVLRACRGSSGTPAVELRTFGRAVAQLLLGTVCAQVLLNGAPILVAAVASGGEQQEAGRFLAAFTLARVPLFIAVPLQSALLPTLTRLIEVGRSAELRRLLGKVGLTLTVVGAAGAGVAAAVGPALVDLVFGPRYVVAGHDLALMVVGVAAHLGLILTTQALVASNRHVHVATTWITSTVAAGLVFALVHDLFLRAELAFAVGSALGWIVGSIVLARTHTPRRHREAPPLTPISATTPGKNRTVAS